jgi:carboxylesterase type B
MVSLEHSKFESFERADFEYSKVGEHSLIASVLTPKKVQEQTQRQVSVLVFWHGGGFVVGDRLYEPWWSDWSVNEVAPSYHCDTSDLAQG